MTEWIRDQPAPIFSLLISRNGRFEQKSLATLAESYVDLKLLPAKPDMARTYTEQFLPR